MPPPRFHPLIRLAICAAGVVFTIGVVSIVITLAIVTASLLNGLSYEEQAKSFVVNQPALLLLLPYPSILLWLWFCRRAMDHRSFISLGLRPRHAPRDFVAGLLGGAAAVSFLFGCLWLTGHVTIAPWSPEAFEAGPTLAMGLLFLWAFTFLIVGFMEETMFRGYGFHNLVAWLGIPGAVIVQAVIFALIHVGNVLTETVKATTGAPALLINWSSFWNAAWGIRWGLVNIALIGVFFALCYLKTGSLWFPIGFHAAWNFFLGCVFSLPVSGINVFRLLEVQTSANVPITGGSFGAEGSVLLVAMNAAMIYLLWRYPDHPQARLDLALLNPQLAGALLPALAVDQHTAEEVIEEPWTARLRASMRRREVD
ncbi:MAG: CPBP family intramembrane metalloprotease, partial [Armatimonadota bacterium]|nr:CPBP family intramembrane metalloprotease [Armatimonadota bacterium]